jgi:large subunit ribosomal protein L23
MDMADVLVRPLVTEKTTQQVSGACYAFEVGYAANKVQVKDAVERFYGVHVVGVRTLIVRGKSKRSGRFVGKRSNWKKAYVRIAVGESINFFES